MTANSPKHEAAFQKNVASLASNLIIGTSGAVPGPVSPVADDLRAGIEARKVALSDVLWASVDGKGNVGRVYWEDCIYLAGVAVDFLAAHPVQDEVTFETTLLDPVWLTTSSSRCTTRPNVPGPVQITTTERREALASLLGDMYEGAVLWADVDAILAALGIVVSDRPEETP